MWRLTDTMNQFLNWFVEINHSKEPDCRNELPNTTDDKFFPPIKIEHKCVYVTRYCRSAPHETPIITRCQRSAVFGRNGQYFCTTSDVIITGTRVTYVEKVSLEISCLSLFWLIRIKLISSKNEIPQKRKENVLLPKHLAKIIWPVICGYQSRIPRCIIRRGCHVALILH